MSMPSNLEPAIHDFTLYKGDKKELIYTFPYDISTLSFELVMFLKKDNSVEIPIEHHVDGTYELYVLLDATGENVVEGTYSYGARQTGDSIPITIVIGDVSLVRRV